jgi:hypothetical protein
MVTTPLARRVSELPTKFQDRLNRLEPKPDPTWGISARYWANPTWSTVCLAVFFLALFLPPDGFPIRLCYFYHLFGVDCPGCGMTRGLSNLWRGRFVSAVGYHWFTPATFIYLILQSSFLFIGETARTRVVGILNRHDRLFRKAWIWGIAAFLVYGIARSVGQLLLKVQV